MSTGFLLVETVPGREGQVLDSLSQLKGVTHRHLLFSAAIAVKLEAAQDVLDLTLSQLKGLDGVLNTRLYKAKLT